MKDHGLRYMINLELGNLQAITTLYEHLKRLQRISAEGADFQIKISGATLNNLKSTIARTVRDGVAAGGGVPASATDDRPVRPARPAQTFAPTTDRNTTAPSGMMRTIQRLATAVDTLASRLGPNTGDGPAAPRGARVRGGGAAAAGPDPMELDSEYQRLKSIAVRYKRRAARFTEMADAFDALTAPGPSGGGDLGLKELVDRLRTGVKVSGSPMRRARVTSTLDQYARQLKKAIQENNRHLAETIEQQVRDFVQQEALKLVQENMTRARGWRNDARREENAAQPWFQRMEERRLRSQGVAPRDAAALSQLPANERRAAMGARGGVGSGGAVVSGLSVDELAGAIARALQLRPNTERDLGVAGTAEEILEASQRRRDRSFFRRPEPGERAPAPHEIEAEYRDDYIANAKRAGQTWAPYTASARNEIRGQIAFRDQQLRTNDKLSEDSRGRMAEEIASLAEQYTAGGVWVPTDAKNARYQDGLWLGKREAEFRAKDLAEGKTPRDLLPAAGLSSMDELKGLLGYDPTDKRRYTTGVSGVGEEMKQLASVDLSDINRSMKILAETMAEVKTTLTQVRPLLAKTDTMALEAAHRQKLGDIGLNHTATRQVMGERHQKALAGQRVKTAKLLQEVKDAAELKTLERELDFQKQLDDLRLALLAKRDDANVEVYGAKLRKRLRYDQDRDRARENSRARLNQINEESKMRLVRERQAYRDEIAARNAQRREEARAREVTAIGAEGRASRNASFVAGAGLGLKDPRDIERALLGNFQGLTRASGRVSNLWEQRSAMAALPGFNALTYDRQIAASDAEASWRMRKVTEQAMLLGGADPKAFSAAQMDTFRRTAELEARAPQFDALKQRLDAALRAEESQLKGRRKGGSVDQGALDAARAEIAAVTGELGGLGIGTKNGRADYGQLLAVVKDENDELDRQRKLTAAIVQEKLKSLNVSEKELGVMGRFRRQLQSIAMYMSTAGLLYSAMFVLRDGLMQAMTFEREMADIQGIFLNKTTTERDQIRGGVLQHAVKFGVPLEEVTGTAKTFAQTGVGPTKTLELTRAAMMARVGAGLDAQQATEMMIAVDNITGGRVSPENIVDRISRIEASRAVSAQDLSVAIQRVGSLAQQMQRTPLGTMDSLDTVIAASTAIGERTRVSGAQSATSLRFMLSRLSAPDVARALQDRFGISLAENASGTQMRPVMDIMGDIAKQYKAYMTPDKDGNVRSVEAAALLTTFAGARQVNAAAALFEDWDDVMQIAEESSLAFGDAQRRLAIQLDTLSSRVERTQNAFYAFMDSMLNNTGVMKLLKGGTSLTGGALNHIAQNPVSGALAAAGILGAGSIGARAGTGFLLGRLGMGAAAAGVGAGLAGSALAIPAAALGVMGVAGGIYNIATQSNAEERRRDDLYGPARIDPKIMAEGDQVRAYRAQAMNYGLTPGDLTTRVTEAIQYAREAVLADSKRFPEGEALFLDKDNAKRRTNAELARTLEEQFVRKLEELLPGFATIGTEAEKVAEGLVLMKGALINTTAYTAVQTSKLAEDVRNDANALMEELRGATVTSFRVRKDMYLTTEAGKRTTGALLNADRDGRRAMPGSAVTYKDIGFAYSTEVARALNRSEYVTRYQDIQRILQATTGFGPEFARAKFYTNQGTSNTLLDQISAMIDSGQTLGQAFDTVATSFYLPSGGDAAVDLARKGNNRKVLADAMRESVRRRFRLDERADATTPGAGTGISVGGGQGAKLLTTVLESLLPDMIREVEAKGLEFAPQAADLRNFATQLADSDNRGRFAAIIQGNKGSGRGLVRDRLLEAVLRYRQQIEEAEGTSESFRRTGVGFDLDQERFSAATGGLRNVRGVSAQIRNDLIRAYSQMQGAEMTQADFQAAMDETEGGRIVLTPAVAKALSAVQGGMSDTQRANLGAQVLNLRQAVSSLTDAQFDAFGNLAPEMAQELRSVLGMDDNTIIANLPNIIRAFEKLVELEQQRQLQRRRDDIALELRGQQRAVDDETGFSARRLALAQQRGLAGRMGDQLGLLNADLADVALGSDSRRAQITRQRDEEIAKLALTSFREFGANYMLAPKFLTELYGITGRSNIALQQNDLQTSEQRAMVLQRQADEALARRRQSVGQLRDGSLQGLREVLGNYERMQQRPLEALTNSVAQTFQQRLADVFVDNLFGENGIFAKQLEKAFDQQWLMDTATITASQVTLIAQGGGIGVPGAVGGPGGSGVGAALGAVGAAGIGLIGTSHYGVRGSRNITSGIYEQGPGAGIGDLAWNLGWGTMTPGTVDAKAQGASAWGNVGNQALLLAGSLGGAALGSALSSKDQNFASTGASIGTMLGSMTPLGPIGGAIGGVLGGLLGGAFGKDNEDPEPAFSALERIERNTRETVTTLENQTRNLAQFDARLLNVPAGFVVPMYNPMPGATAGGGGTTTVGKIEIVVQGATNPEETAAAVRKELQKAMRTGGTYSTFKPV